jgi:predicted transcriptional regulator
MMLAMAGDDEPCELTDEERAVIEQSMAEAARGEFVPDEEVERLWKKLGV